MSDRVSRVAYSILSALSVLVVACVTAPTAKAQEDMILVLDASGSMWGQIEGEAKIAIARKVIGDLLGDLPADRRLGLVAYGHNRKGDCTDIEEVAAVGTDRATIRDAVNAISPKGKTPLSASVKFAAEKLKYTENKATVVLVSDGIETCDLDPCEVGSSLESSGVDFTAHVIGFDIQAEQDRAQLQCLAENTGGRFLDAGNADELSAALEEAVVEAPAETEVDRVTALTLRATELSGGPLLETGLSWKVQQAGGGDVVFEAGDAGVETTELPPGTYDVFVERPADGLKGQATGIEVRPGSQKTVTIPLELSFDATVRTEPEGAAPVSSDIIVYWTGPDRKSDYVTIVEKGAREGAYKDYEYTNEGNPLKLRMPSEAGEYEVRYMLGRPARTLASVAINAVAVDASLEAAETVAAGAPFDVAWQGPGYDGDWITVVKPDAGERAYMSYKYTRSGNPVSLQAPLEAGDYELRYVMAGQEVIARRPITVVAVEATISGPETAMAGTRHPVAWTGPAAKGDWLTITAATARENAYTDYAYVREGSPLTLRMPLEAGEYEYRYVQAGKKVIARQTVTVTAAVASMDAPSAAKVGETVSLTWEGPAEDGDWITVVKPDERENRYTDYEYPKRGNPIDLVMPLEPGDYEYRYVLDGKKVVARKAVTLSDVSVTLNAPSRVAPAADVRVEWTGPQYHRDFVTITKADAGEGRYTSYKYTRDGSPAVIKAPKEPGTYEVRYVLGGKRVVARRPITVAP